MRMFLLGVIVMLLIGVAAAAALDAIQKPASVAFSTGGARPDPE